MNHKKRGVALLFNFETFDVPQMARRSGTSADAENLRLQLCRLNFDVRTYNDLKVDELFNIIEAVSKEDHTDCDCFLMCVLTHGEEGVLYAKDTCYKPDGLWLTFTATNCPSLAGKPKLFFIQACQGSQLDSGVQLRTQTDGSSDRYKIPTFADLLIAYSTLPGFFAWRNTTKGAWFVQALCKELEINAYTVDILTLLTFVNRRVAVEFESNVPNDHHMHAKKQISFITYTLTRVLRFQPKITGA
ncbi:hypothetical protein AAG570_004069 [Ranatra chinensis]|uniref:Caspase n=1 Tax=Ranatra chinensis TaxID=642074 RepID=A0ABD0YKU0_9HEMI